MLFRSPLHFHRHRFRNRFQQSFRKAEHEGKVQILLLGDSTTEGSVPGVMCPRDLTSKT